MGHDDFEKDLAVAKINEKRVAAIVVEHLHKENKNPCALRFNDTKTHDFSLCVDFDGKNKELWFECKEDFAAEKTGRVAIEVSYRNKPSGLSSSKADYWIYTVHEKDMTWMSMWDIDDLREFVFLGNFDSMTTKNGAHIVFVPVGDFAKGPFISLWSDE